MRAYQGHQKTHITMTVCPSLALPAGFTPAGLPVGLQLVGPHHSERRLLAIGKAFEQGTGAGHRHPALPALARRGLSVVPDSGRPVRSV